MPEKSAEGKKRTIAVGYGKLKYFRSRLRRWGRENFDDFPWRNTGNLFHGLIAEILLQRTRAEQVVPVYLNFVERYKGIDDFSKVNLKDAKNIFCPLGLHWRGKQLYDLSRKLKALEGIIPTGYEELTELPGVGPYAANAFISLHLDRPATIIDSNIVRLYERFFGIEPENEMRRKKSFIEFCIFVTPKIKCREFNYALLDLTRKVCKPKPCCDDCPIKNKCDAF